MFSIAAKDYYKSDLDKKRREMKQQQRNLKRKEKELEESQAERSVIQVVQDNLDKVAKEIKRMEWIRQFQAGITAILSEEHIIARKEEESPPSSERSELLTLETMMEELFRPVAVEFFQQRDPVQQEFVEALSNRRERLYLDVTTFFNDCVASARELAPSYPTMASLLEQPIVTEGMSLPEQDDDDDDAEADSIPTRTGEASSLPEDSENQGDDADDDDDDS